MIAVIVPARLDSKRIERKVLQEVGGMSLLWRAVQTLCGVVNQRHDDVTVAIHSPDLFDTSKLAGFAHIPYPPELANESITGLLDFQFKFTNADAILTYNCTSPFISIDTIHKCIDVLQGMVDGTDYPYHDCVATVLLQREFFLNANGERLNFRPGKLIPSQDLPLYIMITTGLIGCTREQFYSRGYQLGESPYPIEVDRVEAIDINFPEDLEFARIVARGISNV
jgi:CMP-N-acetylneuraminic acid synthetase